MRPLAAGRSADVYDLGGGRILCRYHNRARSAEGEAEAISWAGAHGVPVPEVFDVAGPDIVMEKVDGPTMLADLARRPWRLLREVGMFFDGVGPDAPDSKLLEIAPGYPVFQISAPSR
jgi:hypothetical protein